MGTRRWTRNLVAILALALLGACSCSSSDDDDPTPAPTTSSTTTPPEEEVKAAYLAFAEMGARLLQDPNPADPEIVERTSGDAQRNLIDGLTNLRAANQRYVLGPSYGQEVLSVDVEDSVATAEVCVVDEVTLVDTTSNESRGSGTTTALWSVSLSKAGRAWLVDRITETELGEGVLPCV